MLFRRPARKLDGIALRMFLLQFVLQRFLPHALLLKKLICLRMDPTDSVKSKQRRSTPMATAVALTHDLRHIIRSLLSTSGKVGTLADFYASSPY